MTFIVDDYSGGTIMLEQLLKSNGFIYRIGGEYYFLGKWICSRCTDINASDCLMMYDICRSSGEEQNTAFYFQKIRAYSDLALEVPYNPNLIRDNMELLLARLSEHERANLELQFQHFQEDSSKY